MDRAPNLFGRPSSKVPLTRDSLLEPPKLSPLDLSKVFKTSERTLDELEIDSHVCLLRLCVTRLVESRLQSGRERSICVLCLQASSSLMKANGNCSSLKL